MQSPGGRRRAIDQAAGAILVLRIVFNQFTVGEDLPHLPDTDAPDDGLVYRVSLELELVRVNFPSYLFEETHVCLSESGRPEIRHCPFNAVVHNSSPPSLY
jgi:hypothetical protein